MPLRQKFNKLASDAKSRIFSDSGVAKFKLPLVAISTSSDDQSHDWLNLLVLEQSLWHDDPLWDAIKELNKCSPTIKIQLDRYSEYYEIRDEFTALCKELGESYNKAINEHITPLHVTKALRWFCRSIQKDLSYLQKAGGYSKEASGVEDDTDRLFEGYSRVRSHIRCISLNLDATASSWDTFIGSSAACYNSISTHGLKLKRGPCTEGTRIDVTSRILSWADTSSSSSSSVYWINGMAGTGKTTIAYSLCAELDESHRLAASFFCSSASPECQNVRLIIPSLAHQLAKFSHPFNLVLLQVFQQSPDAWNCQPGRQFKTLIVQPLLQVKHTLPDKLVIVIDGLDECDNKSHVRLLVDTILSRTSNLPIKFIISSRPEPEIRESMEKQQDQRVSQVVLHELDKCAVGSEVKTYLRDSLKSIQPTEDELTVLVERTGYMFTYAAMIVRDISYDGFKRDSHRPLSSVVQDYYSREIDEIYSGILQSALEDSVLEETGRDDMRRILYLIACTKESLPIDSISRLLKINSIDRVKAALRPLWSVIQATAENGLVSALHPSFPEYILDASRSTKYCCDPRVYGQDMAQHCFRIFRDVRPQFNICGLPSSYIPDNKVHGIEMRVYNAISNDLFYAAQHWAVHVKHANRSLVVLEELEYFLFNRLLLWMEVMNLKKCARAMPEIIDLIKDRSGSGSTLYSMELRALIHDAWLFTTAFAFGAVSDSTPHIYISMLLFWPNSNPISRCYVSRIQKMIRISGTAMTQRQYALLATWCFDSATQTPVYSPDGSQIAVAVGEKVLLLSASTGRMILPPFIGHSDMVLCISFSPDGAHIVSSSHDESIRVWSTESGRTVVGPMQRHTGSINSVAFSPNGARIVSGSQDDNVYIWDSSNGVCIQGPLTGRHGPIIEVQYSPDGRQIIICGWNGIVIWDAESCQVLDALLPSVNDISFRSMDVSPDGAHIAAGLTDDTICIWNLEKGQWSSAVLGLPIGESTRPTHNPFSSVSFSPRGSHLISSSSDGSLRFWDIQARKLVLGPLHGHTDFITSVSFSPNSAYVISSSHDKTIRVWDTRVRQLEPKPLGGLTGSVTSVEFSPDGTEILLGSADQTVCIWDVEKGQLVRGPFKSPHGDNLSIAHSHGRTLIICTSRNGFTLLDAQTGNIAFGPFHSNQTIQSAALSPDGAHIILALVRNTIRVLKVDTGEIVMDILASTGDRSDWLVSAVPSPDGTCIAAGSIHSSFSIYDSQSGNLLWGPYQGHNNGARSLAFSPDSTHIVRGSFSTISVQGAKGGEVVLGPLGGHKGWVQVVGYSPDGAQIVSGARDHAICVWDAQTGRLTIGPVKWHTAPVRSVGFSPDGRYIASGSDDRTMRVTDISKEWKCIDGLLTPTGCDWELNTDGWIVDAHGDWLVWVPPELRPVLMWPRTKILRSKKGWLRLHFADARIGESWAESYRTE